MNELVPIEPPTPDSLFATPDYEEAVATLRSSLRATRIVKGPNQMTATVPDHPTRLKAAQIILAYGLGTPVSRSEVSVSRSDTPQLSPSDLMKKINESGIDMHSILQAYVEHLPPANA